MSELVDFDATLAEAEGGPATFPFRFLGEVWDLPESPPALAMLKARRAYVKAAELAAKVAGGEITAADAEAFMADTDADAREPHVMLALMIGQPTVDAWLERGMTEDQLARVMRWLWRHYNGLDPNAGESQPPANREERRATAKKTKSSKTGASSRVTSSGSTASKSRAS